MRNLYFKGCREVKRRGRSIFAKRQNSPFKLWGEKSWEKRVKYLKIEVVAKRVAI